MFFLQILRRMVPVDEGCRLLRWRQWIYTELHGVNPKDILFSHSHGNLRSWNDICTVVSHKLNYLETTPSNKIKIFHLWSHLQWWTSSAYSAVLTSDVLHIKIQKIWTQNMHNYSLTTQDIQNGPQKKSSPASVLHMSLWYSLWR